MPPLDPRQFDRVAAEYDETRPPYPARLVEQLGPPGEVLEVGCGSGQLTVDLVAHGHRVLAVDPGENLVRLAAAKCPKVEFRVQTFEAAQLPDGSFDVVASGTAFHWVDPAIAYEKAARVLRSSGRLALLTHCAVAGPLASELDRTLHEVVPSLGSLVRPTAEALWERVATADTHDVSAVLAAIEGSPTRAVGANTWFHEPEIEGHEWSDTLTPRQLFSALVASSWWNHVPSSAHEQLRAALDDLVTRHGGTFPRHRIAFLVTARRT